MNCSNCGADKLVKAGKAQSGNQRYKCQSCGYRTTNPNAPARPKVEQSADVRLDFPFVQGYDRLVITWAQNATKVHEGFLAALLCYCRENNARLVVIPGRYKNPTSRLEQRNQENDQWWDSKIVPYLMNQRVQLNQNLVLIGDVPVQPTAESPLTGFEGLTHAESGILGHPKLELEVIPTPHKQLPKVMTTTGAITLRNYSDTKAGKKGDFHHVFGAALVELDGSRFHLRQINARRDGAFCELDRAYFPSGVSEPCGPYKGIVFGDAHAPWSDPNVVRATFGEEGLVERLNPETLVFHDLLDSYAVNPHHVGNPFISLAKRDSGKDNMRDEVQYTVQWLAAHTKGRNSVIVPSNHDDMFSRWIRREDWRSDPTNAEFYLETALHMVRGTRMDYNGVVTPDPLAYWIGKRGFTNIYCIPKNTSYMIGDIECALHGHEGPNGSRGTIKNLSKIGSKLISGHGHAPGIKNSHYRTGTMTYLSLEYTGPISSWLNAHCSIDPFGKRHLHICVEGAFWK